MPFIAIAWQQGKKSSATQICNRHCVDQDWKTARATIGNDWISNSMSFMSYSASVYCLYLADYIRRLGYSARAHHARNYQVVVPLFF